MQYYVGGSWQGRVPASVRSREYAHRVKLTFPWIAAYGGLTVAVPVAAVLSTSVVRDRTAPSTIATEPRDQLAHVSVGDSEAMRALSGVWSRFEAGGEGDPLRFYYFHGDGKGLYRFGRVGLTYTHSFDYGVEHGRLVLRFRKTGEAHRLSYRVEADTERTGRNWLVLDVDPREPTATRYFRDGEPSRVSPSIVSASNATPAGRMWIDPARYDTGGMGFGLYQLRESGIDGRGVGWHHQGDFDEWSTESLVYRVVDTRIELWFSLRGDRHTTSFVVREDDRGRTLELTEDPRNFWHRRTFMDMGPSFGWSF